MGGQRNRVLGKGLHFPMGMGVFRGRMILINCFPLPLLFHNHCSFPAIRGYHLTLPLLLYTFNCLCHSTLPVFRPSLSPFASSRMSPTTHFPIVPRISWFAKRCSIGHSLAYPGFCLSVISTLYRSGQQ